MSSFIAVASEMTEFLTFFESVVTSLTTTTTQDWRHLEVPCQDQKIRGPGGEQHKVILTPVELEVNEMCRSMPAWVRAGCEGEDCWLELPAPGQVGQVFITSGEVREN